MISDIDHPCTYIFNQAFISSTRLLSVIPSAPSIAHSIPYLAKDCLKLNKNSSRVACSDGSVTSLPLSIGANQSIKILNPDGSISSLASIGAHLGRNNISIYSQSCIVSDFLNVNFFVKRKGIMDLKNLKFYLNIKTYDVPNLF